MKIPLWIELHAAVTHFPIALLLLAVAIDFAAYTLPKAPEKQRIWRQFSLTLLGLAFLSALPSLLTGYLFGRNFSRPPAEFQPHWIAAVLATVLSGSIFAWRWFARDNMTPSLRVLSVMFTLFGAISVGWTGHLGGQMVFGDDTEPETVALVPTPTPDLRDEKLSLFADRMGVAAEKLDLTTEKLALKMKPQPAPNAAPIVKEKTTKVIVQTPAKADGNVSRATEKLDEVSQRYLKVVEKLNRIVSRMEKVPANTATTPTTNSSREKQKPVAGKVNNGKTETPTTQIAAQPTQPAAPTEVATDAKLIAAGETLYMNKETGCTNCHKLAGAGGRGGPPLDGVGTELPDVEWHIAHLINPSSKVPGSKMPAYDDLNQEQLRAIAHYLVSLK